MFYITRLLQITLALGLVSFTISITDPHIIFRQAGTIYAPNDVLNVNFDVNISTLTQACQDFRYYLTRISDKLQDKYDTHGFDYDLNYTYGQTSSYINTNCMTPDLFTMALKEFQERHKRHPALIALAGLGSLITAGLGIYSTAQVNVLSNRATQTENQLENQMMILRNHEARLDAYDDEQIALANNMHVLLEYLETTEDRQPYYNVLRELKLHFDTFLSLLSSFETGYTQLLNSKLSLELLNPKKLNEIWKQIKRRSPKNANLLFQHPLQLLQLPASFTITAQGIMRIFLHVPITHLALTLYKYVPFPITSNASAPLIIKPQDGKTFIAVGDNQLMHLPIAESELTGSCYRFLGNYLCYDLPLFYMDPTTTCLGSLFTNHLDNIQSKCQIQEFQGTYMAESLNASKILLFSKTPTPYRLLCENGTTHMPALHGYQLVDLPPECSLTSRFFRIQPTRMNSLSSTISFNLPRVNVSRMTGGVSHNTFQSIKSELRKVNIEPHSNLQRLENQKVFLDLAKRPQPSHAPHYISGGVTFAIVVVCLGITVFCLYRTRKTIFDRLKELDLLPLLPGGQRRNANTGT